MESETMTVPDKWVVDEWKDNLRLALSVPIKGNSKAGETKIRLILMALMVNSDMDGNLTMDLDGLGRFVPDIKSTLTIRYALTELLDQGFISIMKISQGATLGETIYSIRIGA